MSTAQSLDDSSAPPRAFTRTEQKIIDLLSDGLPHPRRQLQQCLPGEMGEAEEADDFRTLRVHIYNIRRKLPQNELIVCEVAEKGLICYRHVLRKCPVRQLVFTPGPSSSKPTS